MQPAQREAEAKRLRAKYRLIDMRRNALAAALVAGLLLQLGGEAAPPDENGIIDAYLRGQ